jgi:hypothetical protein
MVHKVPHLGRKLTTTKRLAKLLVRIEKNLKGRDAKSKIGTAAS